MEELKKQLQEYRETFGRYFVRELLTRTPKELESKEIVRKAIEETIGIEEFKRLTEAKEKAEQKGMELYYEEFVKKSRPIPPPRGYTTLSNEYLPLIYKVGDKAIEYISKLNVKDIPLTSVTKAEIVSEILKEESAETKILGPPKGLEEEKWKEPMAEATEKSIFAIGMAINKACEDLKVKENIVLMLEKAKKSKGFEFNKRDIDESYEFLKEHVFDGIKGEAERILANKYLQFHGRGGKRFYDRAGKTSVKLPPDSDDDAARSHISEQSIEIKEDSRILWHKIGRLKGYLKSYGDYETASAVLRGLKEDVKEIEKIKKMKKPKKKREKKEEKPMEVYVTEN